MIKLAWADNYANLRRRHRSVKVCDKEPGDAQTTGRNQIPKAYAFGRQERADAA